MLLMDEVLDQLEDFVDGALSADDMATMRARLARESQLAEALEGIYAERALRRRLFASLEPTEDESSRFARRILAGRPTRWRYARPLKIAVGLAACIAVSFAAGWHAGETRVATNPSKAAIAVAAVSTVEANSGYQVALTDDAGRTTAVQHFDSLEKAREFSHDLGQWQEQQKQLHDGAAVVVADRF